MAKRTSIAAFALLAALVAASAAPVATQAATTAPAFSAAGQAEAVMRLTNLDRAALGLPAMTVDPNLASLARNGSWVCPGKGTAMAGRAQDMLNRGYFAHTPTGCTTTILPVLLSAGYGPVAENIGWNNWGTDAATYDVGCNAAGANCSGTVDGVPYDVAVLQRAWMSSAAHRADITGNYDRFGCGVATAATWQGHANTIMAVCLFAKGGPRITDDDAPAFTGPTGGVFTAGDKIHAAVSVSDAAGLVNAKLLVDGKLFYTWTFDAPLTGGRLSIDVPTANLTPGVHVLTWQAMDVGSLIGNLPVAVSIGHTADPAISVEFEWPDAGGPFGVEHGEAFVAWTESAPANLQLARVLTEYRAPLAADGSCTGVSWTTVQTLNPVKSTAAFAHISTNTCYRWRVEVSALGVTAVADSKPTVDGRPSAVFTSPRPYLILNSGTSVTAAWAESNPSQMAYTRTLEVWSGQVVKAGSCTAVAWTLANTLTPTTTSVKLSLAKRTCYRLHLTFATPMGTSQADSGWFLVGIPVASFTSPAPGKITPATGKTFKVRWSIANPTSKAITSETLKVYWTKKTASGCSTSWRLLSSRSVIGSYASISTANGRCYRVTIVARNGWGLVSSVATSGNIRR
jgi:uncharacterized protein YkwD